MRNLVLLNRGKIQPESRTYPDLSLVESVFDVVTDTVTVVLTSQESQVIEVQQFMKNGQWQVLASFPSPGSKILSFNHFTDSSLLVFVFECGDIITAQYDAALPDYDATAVELVGSIDGGLLASSWSPDEETLAILTAQSNLLLLSRLFEPISEKQINPDDIRVADAKHVSVGWGKEETQFKGKGFKALERERQAIKYAGLDLKEDSELRDPTVAPAQKGTVTSFDDGSVEISWRGDCEFFAVTTKEEAYVEATSEVIPRRVIRVFNREGELDSVSEAVDGIEHNLSWRPSGSLIASTQRGVDADGDDVLQVAFYERNGLRHGEFNTRLNPFEESILDLQWSCNSEILAIHLKNRIQIWTTKNYHWYLKQEIYVDASTPNNKVTFIKFHPEKPLQIMVGTSLAGVSMYNFAYKVSSGPTVAGKDVGMTIVIDGMEAKVTPLAIANVPPPIAYREYYLDSPLSDSAVNSTNTAFAMSSSMNDVFVLYISLDDMKKGNDPAISTLRSSTFLAPDEYLKQVCFIGADILAVLVDTPQSSKVVLYNIADLSTSRSVIELSTRAVLLKSSSDFQSAVVECVDNAVFNLLKDGSCTYIARFPLLCHDFEVASVETEDGNLSIALGVSNNGKLFANDVQLGSGITSLKVTQDHLIVTNAHSRLCFVHLKDVLDPSKFAFLQSSDDTVDERVRQIERGSVLISCIPSKYSIVLQAPRGNLETICPRIMVLTGVRQFLSQLDYYKAFMACRTHRVDLDILYDYDPKLFLSNVELFVKQIEKPEFLDLFVSCLHEEDVTKSKYRDTLSAAIDLSKLYLEETKAEEAISGTRRMIINKEQVKTSSKVNKICNSILEVLSKEPYAKKYLNTRITAYACQAPPDLSGALKLASSLDAEEQESALTHLSFLSDVNKLYIEALQLYDIKLALNVAQKSQKDPKEYLPFLQNLHIQEPLRRQFLIDDHLKQYSKALNWLHELGKDATEELDNYVVEHALYKDALAIYKYDEERSKHIYLLYAEYLYEAKKYVEAGLAFEYLGQDDQALESYILGKRWKEALSLSQKSSQKELVRSVAERLSAMLQDDHKYAQAAEIETRMLNNTQEAVTLYCKSYDYDSAILLATETQQASLIESVVDNQLGEGFGVIAELLADCTSQADSQLRRLRELRQKKEDDPYGFYGIANDDLDTPDNVSIAASETSTTPSFFTKYTGKTAGTAKTGASRKTSKNRKREERKRAKGRKGTIYEEEYLIKSVGRLIERLDQTREDALRLVEGMVRRHKIQQAYQIQQSWTKLTNFLKEHIKEIHKMSEKDRERVDDDGNIYLIDEIPEPIIREFPALQILDF